MVKQKINAPGLYPKNDFVKVIPTTEPMGIYFALRHLYTDDKDVNDWYSLKKQKDKYLLEAVWKEVSSNVDYNPWKTINFRNGVK